MILSSSSRPRLLDRALVRLGLGWLALASTLLVTSPASALDRRAEAAGKQALLAAAKDHAEGDDDGGILALQKARKGCSQNRCSATMRASILRDLGALQFAKGDKQKAAASFGEALDLEADLAWNAVYDAPALMAEWAAVKDEREANRETPPDGDFEHVPEHEQLVDTPLPVYAELNAPGVAKVVVKYKVPGETDFKRRSLAKLGHGWGGTIPCQDVKRGVVRYFLQAFDSSGAPIGNSGDVRHTFSVPVRWTIVSEAPHLPGQPPPETCNGKAGGEEETPEPSSSPESHDAPAGAFVRLWIGVSGSIDITTASSASDVCALNASLTPVNSSYYCTTPYGADYPVRTATPTTTEIPVAGKSGNSSGSLRSGDARILATVAYAFNANFLAGVRAGYVDLSYPGVAASKDGHGIGTPIHLELRGMYLFGDAPLARSGFAAYAAAAAGYAKFDVSQTSSTQVEGVVGPRPVIVWKMGGPFFVAGGFGARYAFSPRVAFLAGLKGTLPFGSGGVLPSFAPEIELQYGF